MSDDEKKSGPPRPVRSESPTRPTPVRVAMDQADGGDDAAVGPEPPSTVLEVDDRTWTVRVLGRSRTGPVSAPTHLLLLGFSREEDGEVELEALVAGRSLAKLTEAQLREAMAEGTPPPDPHRERTLFAGATERRSRRN